MNKSSEQGAVAVEFAILLPMLLMLLMGTIEFGHAFNTQVTLTQAAREGVRVMAITEDDDQARLAATNAAPSLEPTLMVIKIAAFEPSGTTEYPDTCKEGKPVRVTISYELESITGLIDDLSLTGRGVMRCGG